MKRELELRDICGYLPYGIYVQYLKNDIKMQQITGISKNGGYMVSINGDCIYDNHLPVLILRPLSDLYRTITHNGKEIIPIVELAKIAEPNYIWEIHSKMAIREIIYETWTDKVFFGYTGLHRYFKSTEKSSRYFYSVYQYDNIEYIPDQISLFDYLSELKIDYRGLIDSGLAIDANTLKNNPYK